MRKGQIRIFPLLSDNQETPTNFSSFRGCKFPGFVLIPTSFVMCNLYVCLTVMSNYFFRLLDLLDFTVYFLGLI